MPRSCEVVCMLGNYTVNYMEVQVSQLIGFHVHNYMHVRQLFRQLHVPFCVNWLAYYTNLLLQ